MAGELLQCLYYPDLEMETIGEHELENGSYRIGLHSDGIIGIKNILNFRRYKEVVS